MDKLPEWAQDYITPERLLQGVKCCLFDHWTCGNCPFSMWEDCQEILLTHLAKEMGLENKIKIIEKRS